MFKNNKNSQIIRGIGIFLVGGLVILSWWFGLFSFMFYLLGLYCAVYIVSYIFKTTAVINFLLIVGGFILYAISAIVGLYLLYLILHTMFNGGFWIGLFWMFLLSVFGTILYFIPMAIGVALGYPLIFMSEDIEKRFNKIDKTLSVEYTPENREDNLS